MSTERCAKLMAIGMANNLDEVWISENPSLLMVYLNQYLPNLFRWYVAHYKRKVVLWWYSWIPLIKTQILYFEIPVFQIVAFLSKLLYTVFSVSRISKKFSLEIIMRSRLPKDEKSLWKKSTTDRLRKMECRTVVKVQYDCNSPFPTVFDSTHQPWIYKICGLSPTM